MRNVGSRYALGVAAFAEVGTESSGIGFRPRLRVWLTDENSIDIAPGAVIAGSSTGPAFTGHIAFNLEDYAALTVHALGVREATYSVGQNSFARTGTSTHTVVYACGRLGSKTGTVAGILLPAAIVALIFASGAGY